jgi:hypothetical protein
MKLIKISDELYRILEEEKERIKANGGKPSFGSICNDMAIIYGLPLDVDENALENAPPLTTKERVSMFHTVRLPTHADK